MRPAYSPSLIMSICSHSSSDIVFKKQNLKNGAIIQAREAKKLKAHFEKVIV